MSDCGVCIGGEGEPIEDYNIGIATAKRAFRCTECGRIIPKNTEHEHVTGRFDGTAINWRSPPVDEWLARAVCFGGAGMMMPLLYFLILMVRKRADRRKHGTE